MGQVDIMELLKNHPDRWFTSKEIAKELGISNNSHKPLLILRRAGFIDFQHIKTRGLIGNGYYIYKYKGKNKGDKHGEKDRL